MKSQEIREKFLNFFKERGHAVVPSSSLIPDDPSVLLTTAGMQQFKPYFMGKADPMRDFGSKNTVSIQKSFRTSDIDEIGDESHLTFFEMLGNFSFGGYFKEEAIKYAHELLKEYGLKIQYVTIFEGDDIVPKDERSREIWKELGVKDIRELPKSDNFWGPTGNEGPCGPTTEIFVNDVEIWNLVFNEYYCKPDGSLEKLETPGVDTGMGLERLAVVLQGKKHVFETDLFLPLIQVMPDGMDERTKRIFADHIRAMAFLISDGVRPSNKEAGYVLRRIIRRVLAQEYKVPLSYSGNDILGMSGGLDVNSVLQKVVECYEDFYPELKKNEDIIFQVFKEENEKFKKTLSNGLKELEKLDDINAKDAFRLYESYGLPYEAIKELAGEKAKNLSREEFEKEFEKHRAKSREGQEAKFGGHGLLLDTGELKARDEQEVKIVTRLHTATHLLQAALREILGPQVKQAGSDITAERARFDFSYDRKLEEDEIKKAEDWINDKIERKLDVKFEEIPYEEAVKTGALYFEKEKYPATVKVYSVIDEKGNAVSKELCGGPHVKNTEEMGVFRIEKQESVGAGIRRIRAVLK
ncbi:MAG: alanine--tRNA ligase [Candidatus Spechtbacteria bacterium]|nr:alanine--tRNA ligase [Candidatus Spechtbacteria bacterium]